MILESKPILNKNLIERYKKIKPNDKNTKSILDITKSSRRACKKSIEISRILNKKVSDNIMYSIILGLRTVYIISSLRENKAPTIKGLKDLILKLTDSEEPYNAYIRSKNNGADRESASPDMAEKLNNYIIKNL